MYFERNDRVFLKSASGMPLFTILSNSKIARRNVRVIGGNRDQTKAVWQILLNVGIGKDLAGGE